jgi:hypothetical protein
MRFRMNFKSLPRCGAKARSNGGQPCRQAAMKNGKCYYHGGSTPVKHGNRSKVARQNKYIQRCSINDARELNAYLANIIDEKP